MKAEMHCCGPEHDTDFFEGIAEVMQKYPGLTKKYIIVCVDHETDIMKIDFEKQGALSGIEGQTVITEFKDLKAIERLTGSRECCGWKSSGDGGLVCTRWWRVQ
jgi:hypothetical protein